MGHERYVTGQTIDGVRPPDELARRLFAFGGVDAVHIYDNMVTVDLAKGATGDGLIDVVRELFLFYRESSAPPDLGATAEPTTPAAEPARRRCACADAVSVLRTPLQIGGTTTVRNRLYRAPVLEGAGRR